MKSRQQFAACFLAVTIFLSGVGCTSMKTVSLVTDPTAPVFGRLAAGDTVIVETSDGRRARFVVKQIDGDTIVAQNGDRFARADITQVQRKSFSGLKTALLAAGIMLRGWLWRWETPLEISCPCNVRRALEIATASLTGTIPGSSASDTTSETWNVFDSPTGASVGVMTMNGAFSATRR